MDNEAHRAGFLLFAERFHTEQWYRGLSVGVGKNSV